MRTGTELADKLSGCCMSLTKTVRLGPKGRGGANLGGAGPRVDGSSDKERVGPGGRGGGDRGVEIG
jgi:hypothetical protein